MTYVSITFEPDYANMVTGLWCEDCALPSVVRLPMLMFSSTGICPAGDLISCKSCGDVFDQDGDDGGELVGG